MMVGLYAALATSASVFIGILTALLVNNLTNMESKKDLLERRIETLDSQIQGVQKEKENIEEYATNIEEPRFTEKPRFSPEYENTHSSNSEILADIVADSQSTRQHNERHRRWNQICAQLVSLNNEQEQLFDRYKSIDDSNIKETLYTCTITIILSVGIPLFTYLLRVSGVVLPLGPLWLEPVIVFAVWTFGLGSVLYHINIQVAYVSNDI